MEGVHLFLPPAFLARADEFIEQNGYRFRDARQWVYSILKRAKGLVRNRCCLFA